MNINDKMFLAAVSCVQTELDMREALDDALEKYNDLFVPGSKKILRLISEEEYDAMRHSFC